MQFVSPEAKATWLRAKAQSSEVHLFGCAETWALALEARLPTTPISVGPLGVISGLLQNPTPARVHVVAGMLRGTWQHGDALYEWCLTNLTLA